MVSFCYIIYCYPKLNSNQSSRIQNLSLCLLSKKKITKNAVFFKLNVALFTDMIIPMEPTHMITEEEEEECEDESGEDEGEEDLEGSGMAVTIGMLETVSHLCLDDSIVGYLILINLI